MYRYKIYVYIDMASWLIASIPILGYSTSFPQVGPNPKWLLFSIKVDQLSHLETKSVVWRCIVWYLKHLLHPKFKKFALEKWMVGILVSVWDGLFSGAFAVSFREGYYLPQFTDKVWQLIASMQVGTVRGAGFVG